jgi:hypothetical protein
MLLLTIAGLVTQPPSAVARGHARCNAFKGKRLLRSWSVVVIARTEGARREYVCLRLSSTKRRGSTAGR